MRVVTGAACAEWRTLAEASESCSMLVETGVIADLAMAGSCMPRLPGEWLIIGAQDAVMPKRASGSRSQ